MIRLLEKLLMQRDGIHREHGGHSGILRITGNVFPSHFLFLL